MKKLLAVLFMLALFSAPVLAQEPWRPAIGDEQFVGDITWQKVNDESTIRVDGSWFHFTGARHKTGVGLFGERSNGETGIGLGPSYLFRLAQFPKGDLWVGGTAFAFTQEATEVADGAVQAEIAYELYIGKTASLRVGARYMNPINEQDPVLADAMTDYNAFIGFGIFVNKDAAVN